ncbi:MAG TPA: M20/M25/M40 family metallo-hydrolase [Gemmatimonadales bacterium]
MRSLIAVLVAVTIPGALVAQAPTEAAQKEAREILKEMVSLNTSLQRGDVTPLAEKLAARFRAAGVPAADVQLIGPEVKNKNLVVRLRGTGKAKPVLFLAHLDVVDAMRTDWSFDPYALTEKDGWLYGRGTADDKGPATTVMAAALALVRSHATHDRDIIIAFTSGEENGDVPGAEWLVKNHKELVDAEWVFNFDAGGPALERGRVPWIELQGSEKVYYTIAMSVHNSGGHSSLPRADNAIYRLVSALRNFQTLTFPIDITAIARAQLTAQLPFVPSSDAPVIRAALAEPLDSNAAYRLTRVSPSYNALLRTTCIPTMLTAGVAENALPPLATATINCRIIPGENSADILRAIRRVVDDTAVTFTDVTAAKPSPPSPLLPERIALVKAAARATWGRDIPVTPVQENGATDGLFFRNAGVPVYGVTGIAIGEERMHGNDERIPVKSLREGVTFATALMRETAGGKVAARKK